MAKTGSNILSALGRVVKCAMVAVLIPLAAGLLQSVLQELDMITTSRGTFRQWMEWGFATYVWIHLLLYRPVTLFRVSHRLFSILAVWIFGGQVSTVGAEGGKGKGGKGGKGEMPAEGSTLVAFSPYVIPLYAILVCAAALLLHRWLDRAFVDAPVSFLIGLLFAFHWLMTAEDLQRQRDRWHAETYLLAIGLVFVVTLLIGGACLPWAVPEFSFLRVLSDGLVRTQAIYAALIRQLFL